VCVCVCYINQVSFCILVVNIITMFMFVAVLKFHTGKASANGRREG
jgi:hypothetical protein